MMNSHTLEPDAAGYIYARTVEEKRELYDRCDQEAVKGRHTTGPTRAWVPTDNFLPSAVFNPDIEFCGKIEHRAHPWVGRTCWLWDKDDEEEPGVNPRIYAAVLECGADNKFRSEHLDDFECCELVEPAPEWIEWKLGDPYPEIPEGRRLCVWPLRQDDPVVLTEVGSKLWTNPTVNHFYLILPERRA